MRSFNKKSLTSVFLISGMKLTSQNTLDTRAGAMVETWHEAADLLNQHIFSGDPIGLNGNLDLLKHLIIDGKFAGSDLDLLSAEELDGHIKKALYGQLISLVWASSTVPSGVVLLRKTSLPYKS